MPNDNILKKAVFTGKSFNNCYAEKGCPYFELIEMKKVCKWYVVCPMKRFYEERRLERKWIEEYCMGDYMQCVRYKLEVGGNTTPR